ncbi:hypothetical protein BGX38DRAFT_1165675 [Terfezia claveryi]|nr:hypothetical protein BGX38DRAFT_1165675 [Terfezia claveryi]
MHIPQATPIIILPFSFLFFSYPNWLIFGYGIVCIVVYIAHSPRRSKLLKLENLFIYLFTIFWYCTVCMYIRFIPEWTGFRKRPEHI